MKARLFYKGLVFLLLMLGVSYATLFLNPNYKTEYIAGVSLKLEKLRKTKEKKIVIIGGSNGSFGIDSRLMEKKLGVPVVNMTLHGGLPFKYILEQVKAYLNKGDILILTKEYGGLKNQYWNKMNGIELPKIITYDLSQLKALSSDKLLFQSTLSGIFKTINFNIKRFPSWKKKLPGSVYSLGAFDEDNLKSELLIGNYEKEISKHNLPILAKDGRLAKNLQLYVKEFDKKGIGFFVTPPVIIEGYYEEKDIIPFWRLFSNATKIELLNTERTYVYPRYYFLNSHYHTNAKGREVRTKSLIKDIRNSKSKTLEELLVPIQKN
jgi:hypothetical protein